MKKTTPAIAALCFTLFFTLSSHAQLQSPEQFLGYELGERWTPHHRVMDYVSHVAEESGYVTLQQYGESYEHRKLVLLFVTAPQNHENLEEIRLNNLRLTGLEEDEATDNRKGIVWLSYNIHGNETSSSEAAMKTLFELVSGVNGEARSWLENTVVIMDPMVNPDGRERYVNWYNQMTGLQPDADPQAREHDEPWPGGRSNHYLFDLNRDWAWQIQQESRYRYDVYREWFPHIHVDFHEQGYQSPYYFAPAAEPYHEIVTDWQTEFQKTIGENHMKTFDREGWLYFTRERFDLFYPSYGDTWPTFHGAIGMTYEQAGHVGLTIQLAEGDSLTLLDRLTHHHATGLSTVETASVHSERMINEFQSYFENALTNPGGRYKTYVVKGDNDPDKLYRLLSSLDRFKIEYGRAGRDFREDGYNYSSGEMARSDIEANDILIPAAQPQGNLVRVLFEPDPELSDSLTYDITAWEAHYRYGLEGFALEEEYTPEGVVSAGEFRTSEYSGAREPYAYVVEWDSMDDARFLAEITHKGVNTRFTTVPFEIDGRSFDRGTLIIPRINNEHLGNTFDAVIRTAAENHSRSLFGASTGFVTSGSDFGSGNVEYIEHPEVAILLGEGTSSLNAGEIWHYFDRQLNYPVTLIHTNSLGRTDLGRYNTLLLPSGSYRETLTESRLNELGDWVRDGGRLISFSSANRVLSGNEHFLIKEKQREESETTIEQALASYGERSRRSAMYRTPGSIYRVDLDNTHPMAFGYDNSYFTLKTNAGSFQYLESGWNVGTVRTDGHRSGFAGAKAREVIQHSLSFGVQNHGSGEVIYFTDNPLFRGFWENGKLLVANALFLVGN